MIVSDILTVLIPYWLSTDIVQGATICYDNLGCFHSDNSQRKAIPLPWSPDRINTRFLLHTRDNPPVYQEILSGDMMSVRNSSFRQGGKTIFIAHGLADTAKGGWVSQLIQEILRVEDVNCVGVDWSRGSADLLQYSQASSNVQVVGGEIAYLVTRLQEELKYPPSNIHLIGHSLGAHAAGEAGRRCPGIGRITGLDPARPHFQDSDPEVHLDASDAEFVDVLHTDTDPVLGLGVIKPVGHFDYYPNGGQHMTGCPSKLSFLSSNSFSLVDSLTCNHLRAPLFYMESVRNPPGFLAYPCDNYEAFQDGSCFPCPPGGCPVMGHYAGPSYRTTHNHQTFYLHTGGDPGHFSSYRYKVSVSVVGKKETSGRIFISFFGDFLSTSEHPVVTGALLPGGRYSAFIDSPIKLDEVNCLDFRWTPSLLQSHVSPVQLGAEQVDIQSGEDGKVRSFCSSGAVLKDVVLTLGPCRFYGHPYPKSKYRSHWL